MAYECPHCSKDIPGVTTEEKVKERIAPKNVEIAQLRAELKTAKELSSSAETLKRERDEAQRELAEFQESATRSSALAKLGIDTSTDDGKKLERTFLTLHKSENLDLEEGDRKSFGDWLAAEDGARANPLLDRYFQGTDTDTTTDTRQDDRVGNRRGRFPSDRDTKTPPPDPKKKMSSGELREFLQKKTPAEVRQWMEKYGEPYGMAPPPKDAGDVSGGSPA